MKNILITGVAGLIGSNLAQYHLNNNDRVFGLDNFSSSDQNSIHFKKLKNNNNFFFSKIDISSNVEINQHYFSKYDVIYHLACPASPKYFSDLGIEIIKANTIGTIYLIETAKKFNCPIVVASSSEIYGNLQEKKPIYENFYGNVNCFGPRACYDEAKRAQEAICFNYINSKKYENIRIPRIFNTYGPNLSIDDGRVISNFIVNALKNDPLIINENENENKLARSFCYVDDTVNALIKLVGSNINTPINVGNNKLTYITNLAKNIITITNSQSRIQYAGELKDDPVYRNPDITTINNLLKWYPSTPLSIGLNKTIGYFKHVINITNSSN